MDLAQPLKADADDRYRLLVDAITDYAIYMLDADGRVTNWNPGAQRFKGYAADEIIGSHFSRFYTDEDREAGVPQRALATAAAEGKFEAEGWRVRKDGQRFWAHVVIDPIRDPEGRLIGYAKITRDLTERVEAQRELELAREALFQSQKLEAIGRLTGGVAHDFNNLLMAIMGSLTLLRKRIPADPRAERLIANAIEAAQRGATLTQRMLAFARRQDLHTESVDVPQLVHGMADLLRRTIGPAWRIETRFPLRLSPVIADPNQLEMAVLNLVVNARDAMAGGGPILIEAAEEPAEGDGPAAIVRLSVIDRGTGMDAETLARATEPFFTTKGVGKGTGLGLSMIHGFAEQTGGAFRLESEPGQGTAAHLLLPVAPVQAPARPARCEEDEEVAGSPPLTVLAVDDDPLVLMNTVAMLEDQGHKVIEAASGEEALSRFAETPSIDLVITDQAMPAMTGIDLVRAMRERLPTLPAVIATGYGELSDTGGLDYRRLGKPFGAAQLAKAVREATAAQPAEAEGG